MKLKLDVQKIVTEILKFGGDENGALSSLNKNKTLVGSALNVADIQKMIKKSQENIDEQSSEERKIVYKLKG